MRTLSQRISGLFARQDPQHAMFLAGSVAASMATGMPVAEFTEVLGDGLSIAISHCPFAPTADAVGTYFDGAAHWLSSTALGVADWVQGVGGELTQRARVATNEARAFLGDRSEEAKLYFEGTIAKSAEFASIWRNTVRDSLLADPQAVVKAGTDILKTVAEYTGVALALKEAYCWVAGKKSEKDEKPVTNIHLNVALSKGETAGEVLEQLSIQLGNGSTTEQGRACCGRRAANEDCAHHKSVATSEQIVWASEKIAKNLPLKADAEIKKRVSPATYQAIQANFKKLHAPKAPAGEGDVCDVNERGAVRYRTISAKAVFGTDTRPADEIWTM